MSPRNSDTASSPEPASGSPLLSLSLDLDNKWSYMKTHGDAGWECLPSYLERLAEVLLEPLRRRGLRLTFFVVGRDAAQPANAAALRALADAGHGIGNHSYEHEPWLHRYTDEQVAAELESAEQAIEAATGVRPLGFRGPGFSLSQAVLRTLVERGYRYDASTFPTFLGPLARAYYFWKSRRMSAQEKEDRAQLFGTLAEGLRPLRPYVWRLATGELLEVPVTTFPVVRAPMHLSYQLYLAGASPRLALTYLRAALLTCRARGVEPSVLLHPLDFLGGDDVQGLDFFPGMQHTTRFKLDFFERALDVIQRWFEPVALDDHAEAILRRGHGLLDRRPARSLP